MITTLRSPKMNLLNKRYMAVVIGYPVVSSCAINGINVTESQKNILQINYLLHFVVVIVLNVGGTTGFYSHKSISFFFALNTPNWANAQTGLLKSYISLILKYFLALLICKLPWLIGGENKRPCAIHRHWVRTAFPFGTAQF